MDVFTITSPIGLWALILRPRFCILTIAILDFWSQKLLYLDEWVEKTVTLATSLVSTMHLQSMINCYNANANANANFNS